VILVTGAAGTVGARLVQRLVDRGNSVRALVLPHDPFRERLADIRCEVVEGDITRPRTLDHAVDGVATVFHLAAVILSDDEREFERVNVGGTRNLLAAARGAGVGHFIYVSSASVVYPRGTPYSLSKRASERLVRRQQGMHHTIVRPTLVYERGGGREFQIFADYVRRWPVVPLVGGGTAKKSPVHVADLIDGLSAIAGNEKTFGKVYNLGGGETVTLRELAELLVEHQGRPTLLVPVPVVLCKAVALAWGAMTGRGPFALHTLAGLTQDADLDISRSAEDLGYAPIGIRRGLRDHVFSPMEHVSG
jgi:nucleoside-diphosphate-sugar epimerase